MSAEPAPHKPYVPDDADLPEFTWFPVVVGALLGIVFGASSLYLVLKAGLTVSASIPVAVLAITLFRGFAKLFGLRPATILENNVVQTTGSAGESLAFGVGVTMPVLLMLGFDIDVIRVMTVGVFGGLIGILMMIPLRRAFIVKQHGKLTFPEGTACADVLVAGEKGGATALMIFLGFGLSVVYTVLMKGFKLWSDTVAQPLWTMSGGKAVGLKGGVLAMEATPELLGVGYIIGPRIACITVAGGLMAWLVLAPVVVYFGESATEPISPAVHKMAERTVDGQKSEVDVGLVRNMSVKELRENYISYIGAGAVAAGGIISMFQALPVILASVLAGFRDLRGTGAGAADGGASAVPRTSRDLSMRVVLFGSLGMVVALAVAPNMGLGLNITGVLGAILIVFFGFLFVTVSSRLTGEIGSSSNPISGMTVATLLLTCLIFLGLDAGGYITISKEIKLTALTIAAVVCVASSNGGSTAQALKTGHLVGATPKAQQLAILIGSLTSALVIGFTLILLNQAGTAYSKKGLPDVTVDVSKLTQTERVLKGMYKADTTLYHVLNVGEGEMAGVPQGKYLVNDEGRIVYLVDPAVNGRLEVDDDGNKLANKFDSPKTRLMAVIIDGILSRKLEWGLVLIGVLIAVTLELLGVPSLPFAVGVYLPLSVSMPIFVGGMVRWGVDRMRRMSEAEAEMSPGVLLCSGLIAGGTIAALLLAFFEVEYRSLIPYVGEPLTVAFTTLNKAMDFSKNGSPFFGDGNLPTLAAFSILVVTLASVGGKLVKKG